MRNIFLLVFAASVLLSGCSTHHPLQDKPSYRIFDQQGHRTDYAALVRAAGQADVLLFGERHYDSVIHWLQLSVTKDLAASGKPLVMGLEMIEKDNQAQLDQYLRGEINQKTFTETARLWSNYKSDYKPLVDFAKSNDIRVIATNIPRKYASMVYKQGGLDALNGLSAEEKSWMAPLPIRYDGNLSQYRRMWEGKAGDHSGDTYAKSQAIKDATMAHSILQNLVPGSLFIHYNGAYHSDFHEGIHWYLKQDRPGLSIVTISAASQHDLSRLEDEHLGKADFIIAVDKNVVKTL